MKNQNKPESGAVQSNDHASGTQFPERLRQLRAMLAKTQPEMDTALTIGKRSWQRYESGKVSPGSQVIAGLIDLGFSANWVLRGQGPMLIEQIAANPDPEKYFYARGPDSKSVQEQSQSYQQLASSVANIGFSRDWLKSIDAEPEQIIQFLMPDDAMAPQIKPGAVLFADRSKHRVEAPGIWALRANRVITAARVQPGSGEKLLVSHDNPAYRDILLDGSNDVTQIVGKVIWHGGPIL